MRSRSAQRADANLRDAQGMPGAGFTCAAWGKALPERPTFQPYWGKPAVRNDRGTVETSASFEARYGPLSHPTIDEDFGCTRAEESSSTGSTFRAGSNPLSSTMIPKNLLVS